MTAVPTDASERIPALDILRGAALVGIAIVNVPWLGSAIPLGAYVFDPARRATLGTLDLVAAFFVELVCEGKFYPGFAMLFGVGTALFLARGAAIPFARRMTALLLFGVLHTLFGWWGDILLNYALVGFVLLAFSRVPPRFLFVLSGVFLVAGVGVALAYDDWLTAPEDRAEAAAEVARQTRLYTSGFATITRARYEEGLLGYFAKYEWSYRLNVLYAAFFGLGLGRSGFVQRLATSRGALGVAFFALLALGLALTALTAVEPRLYMLPANALSLAYASGGAWLATHPRLGAWLSPFASVGRLAITCYLLQTVAFTLTFYGYGLGLYGQLGPAAGCALAVGVYAAEALFANVWLRAFRFGPVEWLWRALTYLHAPPMRRT